MPPSFQPSTPHKVPRRLNTFAVLATVLAPVDLLPGLFSVVRAMTRPRVALVAENALRRRQLLVLRRQVRRPKLTHADRWWMVLTARLTQRWEEARMLVQPATLLRGHGALSRRWWTWKSSAKRTARPPIAAETTTLIRQLATANWLWGAERIRGERLKLGVHVYLKIERGTAVTIASWPASLGCR
jgi:hypothetical protein